MKPGQEPGMGSIRLFCINKHSLVYTVGFALYSFNQEIVIGRVLYPCNIPGDVWAKKIISLHFRKCFHICANTVAHDW